MTRTALSTRLCRLENGAGTMPPYIRRWLGETLTDEEHAQADAEWQGVQAKLSAGLSHLTPEAQEWLTERGAPV